jgi:hypothetical protein
MNPINAGCFGEMDFLGESAEVSGEDGGGDRAMQRSGPR